MENRPWQNSEGYADPTAHAALKSIEQDEAEQQKRVNALIYVLKYIINAAGHFHGYGYDRLRDIQSAARYMVG